MRDADVAMYRAKADGKGRHAVFDAACTSRSCAGSTWRPSCAGRSRSAGSTSPTSRSCRRRPAASSASRRSAAGPAASRPSSSPIAEETGLIVPLGRWVLRTACAQLAEWRALPAGAGLTISVNVSHRQLADTEFCPTLANTLTEADLDPRALRLEIKEHDAQPRAGERPARAPERARQARRAHAHRRLRHRRVAAAPAARLPGRRDEDPPRAGGRDRPRRRRVRDRARSSASRTTSGSR